MSTFSALSPFIVSLYCHGSAKLVLGPESSCLQVSWMNWALSLISWGGKKPNIIKKRKKEKIKPKDFTLVGWLKHKSNCFCHAAPTQDWCPDLCTDCYCMQANAAVFEKVGTAWCSSTHCGSWVLAPGKAKQNLIPSASKARPPLSNPMLSSRVVRSAHIAVPLYISPLGWKKMLLVGMRHPALFIGLYDKQIANTQKSDNKWSQSNQTGLRNRNLACMYLFSVDDHRWLRYLQQHYPASLPHWIWKQQLSTSDHLHLCPIILK